MRTISITVMVIISKVLIWKLLDIGYIQSSFSTFTRHIDNGIWKTPCSWRFYSNGSPYVLTNFSLENIMKRKCAKVPGKLSVVQFWACFMKSISLVIVFFFFSQTNLVFKFNLMLVRITFATIYLPFCLLIFCISWSSSRPLRFCENQ